MPNLIPNLRKVGAEWVNNYSYPFTPRRSSLTYCSQNANEFFNILTLTQGATPPSFIYGDGNAWDRDFEQAFDLLDSAAPPAFLSGDDDLYAEKVDILFFSGHGNQDGLLFGVPNKDNGEAKYDEIQLGQGGKLKWFAIDACKVLEESASGASAFRWGRIFKGLRQLLSFHKDCRDVPNRGKIFAQYLKGVHPNQIQFGTTLVGETISRSWELACIETSTTSELAWAHLRRGNANSIIKNDRWTDDSVLEDTASLPTDFTYARHIPPANSSN